MGVNALLYIYIRIGKNIGKCDILTNYQTHLQTYFDID